MKKAIMGCEVERIMDVELQVQTQNIHVVCLICNSASDRVHIIHQRSLLDVSWGNYQVYLKPTSRNFYAQIKLT